jgi:hypothetical protein
VVLFTSTQHSSLLLFPVFGNLLRRFFLGCLLPVLLFGIPQGEATCFNYLLFFPYFILFFSFFFSFFFSGAGRTTTEVYVGGEKEWHRSVLDESEEYHTYSLLL